jgi:hypothetical protein
MTGDYQHGISSYCRQTGYSSRAARERAIHEVRHADGIGGDSPTLEEAFVTLTLGRRPLKTLVFVVNITDDCGAVAGGVTTGVVSTGGLKVLFPRSVPLKM